MQCFKRHFFQNRVLRKSVSFSQNISSCPADVERPENLTSHSIVSEMNRLCEKVKTFQVDPENNILSPDDTTNGFRVHESPWLQIARRDYQNVLRQLQKDAAKSDCFSVTNSTEKDKVPPNADNTSSAYSTGESFRSSGSATESRLGGNSVVASRSKQGFFDVAAHSCGTSSDANSDFESPACYLTHVEDGSESEGFQDAVVEFSSNFTNLFTVSKKPILLSQTSPLLPKDPEFVFYPAHSQSRLKNDGSESKEMSKATGRESSFSELKKSFSEKCQNKTQDYGFELVPASNQINCLKDKDFSCSPAKRIFAGDRNLLSPSKSCLKKIESEKVVCLQRRKSEAAIPVQRPKSTQRSVSCVETSKLISKKEKEAEKASTEWKVRIRSDGSRYITKRTARDRAVRHRERRRSEQGSARASSDEDRSDFKLGRQSSRDDRKRQYRVAREKKRRRDYMQRRRLDALGENATSASAACEIGLKKISVQKQKRMVLDDFVTVQELLAHGSRVQDIAKLNPMLSVTYI